MIQGTEPYIVGGHTASGFWVDTKRETTIHGLYAAGDVAGGCPQKYVTGALAEGKIASLAIIEQLKSASVEQTSTIEDQAQAALNDYEKIRSTQNGLFTIDDLEEAMQKVMDEYAGGIASNYSLLLDGLMAEREQGITIDVAYRYFTTDKRSFIVADTPGHEEYTRNMAVGASFAQLAIILVDAKQGVLVQTRRHSRICALMGIHHFVFAVNKMDLVGYSEERFNEIVKDINELSESLGLQDVVIVPVSATEGDNVTVKSENMPWYTGKTLLDHLETVDVTETESEAGFYMPVQRVCRPNHEFRGFQGQIESGKIKV